MAKYLKPRRGTKTNAQTQKIVLQKGEMFLEMANNDSIGNGPGRIVIGNGSTAYNNINYNSTVANTFRPFITDPSIYVPQFANSSVPSSGWSVNSASGIINTDMGNGSTASTVTLPTIIGKIKQALALHDSSITKLNNDLAGKADTNHTHSQYSTTSHNHDSTYLKLSGGTMSGAIVSSTTIKPTSLYMHGGNGDLCNYSGNPAASGGSDGNELWRIWREAPTTASYSPRYRASNTATAGALFTGFLALSTHPNARIIFDKDGNLPAVLKQGQAGVFFFYRIQGQGGTPAIAIGEWHNGGCFWSKYNCGDTGWIINYNTSGTVVATHGSDAISAIGIVLGTAIN